MSTVWHVRSRIINEVVQANNQFTAWATLRDRDAAEFGLIATAECEESGDPIPVHTSALMTWWGREEEAELFRQVAMENGLPDTTESDRRFAAAREAT